MSTTIDRFAANLRKAFEESGLSVRNVERKLWELLGNDAPTYQTVRNYLAGNITEHRINLQLVVGLCVIFDVSIAELSPELAADAERFENLLIRAKGAA